MRISDWSSDVCSSDLADPRQHRRRLDAVPRVRPWHPLSAPAGDLSVARERSARIRRISEPGERELAAEARVIVEVRDSLSDRQADCAGAGSKNSGEPSIKPWVQDRQLSGSPKTKAAR